MKNLLVVILALSCCGCTAIRGYMDKFDPGVLLSFATNVVEATETTTNAVVETNVVAEADSALNPQPSEADIATGQKQECKFKVDNDGHGGDGKSRVVVRWPSFLTHLYELEKGNSYTTIDGVRLEWQKIDDEEHNARASFQILRRGDTFPRNSQVYLIVDEKIVAGFVKSDPGVYNAKFSLPKRMKDVVK